jgi:hypothetical protein
MGVLAVQLFAVVKGATAPIRLAGRGWLFVASLALVVLGGVSFVGGSAAAGPRVNLAKLNSCVNGHAPTSVDDSGDRSTGYLFESDVDPNVEALVVVSGLQPRLGTVTRILSAGRTPTLAESFANGRIATYVFHKNGVAPSAGAVASLTREMTRDVRSCVARSR